MHQDSRALTRANRTQGVQVRITGPLHMPVPGFGPARAYLLHLRLQVAQLHTLLQVLPMLLCSQVQLLLLFMKKLQQVLDPRSHVHVSIAKQLHACGHQRETLGFNSHFNLFLRLHAVCVSPPSWGRPSCREGPAQGSVTPAWQRVRSPRERIWHVKAKVIMSRPQHGACLLSLHFSYNNHENVASFINENLGLFLLLPAAHLVYISGSI